ncbi:glucosaminidase domain-containing protein [Thalassolituus marinus]|uniref:Glucosaminidase domain-containing protein n=1 Tax=Thalassolituus marinus TaxID=671053 RepID=A0ABS7ZU76_9GAMM|nr:glucosaminidase domain-containing protein [Thalassolituus marinus]MCA6063946.1 glucosaminidase domain-containing protein [Thalassolituus marinus]
MRKYLLFLLLAGLAGCEQKEKPAERESLKDIPPLPDFSSYTDVKAKKQAFFDYLLPLVREANARVMEERQLAQKWVLGEESLSTEEQTALTALLKKYRINTSEEDEQKDLLLRRVNRIPASLVIAQAANESGWGTSRFAIEGNNLFGQWCFTKGCGLIPEGRGDGQRHEVRRFRTPLASVESYIRNLNSHPQYLELRNLRVKSLEEDGRVSGLELVPGLESYSERGQEYIDEISNMIRFNKMGRFDQPLQSQSAAEASASGG